MAAPKKKKMKLPLMPKGKSVFHQYVEEKEILNDLPDWKIKKLSMSKVVVISGPYGHEVPNYNFTHAFGSTTSTYPHYPDNASREGDPICDSFRSQTHENGVLFCVTDGCNWGERPKEASNRAKDAFIAYLNSKIMEIKLIQELGDNLISALSCANHAIVYDKEDVWMAGTTTLLGGAVVEIDNKANPADPSWAFVSCTIGDCKAFLFRWKDKTVADITAGNRINVTDARDPGGRIGPYVKDGQPDLRNLGVVCMPVEEGDIIFVVSDGVHDNLDPQTLGKTPQDLNLGLDDADATWSSLDRDKVSDAKTDFECQFLEKLIGKDEDLITPKQIVKKLLNHCLETTGKGRQFMEQNPNSALEHDYAKYPGKMDHTTCVAFKVGHHDPSKENNKTEALRPDVWPF